MLKTDHDFIDLRSFLVNHSFEGLDELEIGRRSDIVVPLQLLFELDREITSTGVELLTHCDTGCLDIINNIEISERPSRYSF